MTALSLETTESCLMRSNAKWSQDIHLPILDLSTGYSVSRSLETKLPEWSLSHKSLTLTQFWHILILQTPSPCQLRWTLWCGSQRISLLKLWRKWQRCEMYLIKKGLALSNTVPLLHGPILHSRSPYFLSTTKILVRFIGRQSSEFFTI